MYASLTEPKTPNWAVGILYFSHIFFVNILEPSSCEEILLGPNTFIPLFVRKSTIPSTRGFSGPTITKSILYSSTNFPSLLKSNMSSFTFSAINLVPALPGKQYNLLSLGDFDIWSAIACSLPPFPII